VRAKSMSQWMAVVIFLTLPIGASAGTKASDVRQYISTMTQAKTLAESYVGIAQEHIDPKSDAYVTAQKKYADAYSKYSAWFTDLQTAIRQGDTRHLDEDSYFQKQGEAAATAGTDFVSYVDNQTQHSKAVVTVFTDIVTAALKIWQAEKDVKGKAQQNLIDDLNNNAKWKSWKEISDSSKPEPSKPKTPQSAPPGS
jgi:hypothetical protein